MRLPRKDREPLLRKARERHPNDFWVNFERGNVLVLAEGEKSGEAEGCNWTALALRPKTLAVLNNLGTALNTPGRLEEAISAYRRAIKLDPKLALPHNSIGLALYKQGRLDEAVAEYEKAIELDPKYAKGHFNLGIALHDQNKLPKATAEYREAVKLAPHFARPTTGSVSPWSLRTG